MVDAQFIGDNLNCLKLKTLRKQRLTDVKDTYVNKVL